MRFLNLAGAAALLACGVRLSAQSTPAPPPPPAPERSGIDKVGDTIENIGEKPLKDLNLMKAKVAPELEAVMAAPYSLKGIATCAQYKTEIARMTKALGPDVDSAQANTKKDGETPAEFALGAGESLAGGLIPGGGLIRKISGAEKRQKYAAATVYAGSIRRAYLKGAAKAKGCRG